MPPTLDPEACDDIAYVDLAAADHKGFGLQRWFTGVITPNFKSPEGQKACNAADAGDTSPLAGAHRRFRRTSKNFNDGRVEDTVHPALVTRWFAPLQAGSLRTCSSTLVASSLGTGLLSLPYAFSLCGLGLGMVTLTFAAVVAALSSQVLIMASRYTECRSFAALLELAVGHSIASVAVDLTILLLTMGAMACYLIFEGDFLPALCAPFAWLPVLDRSKAIIGVAALVWPLTLPSDLASLRYVTVASPVVLLGTTFAVLSETPSRFADARAQGLQIQIWDFEPSRWLMAFSIMLAAFTNQHNVVAAGSQLSRPSIKRIVKTTTYAVSVSWVMYAVIGLGGYLSWLSLTQPSFMNNYPQGSAVVWACRAMLAIALYFVVPVVCLPSATALLQLIARVQNKGGCRQHTNFSARVHAASATAVLSCATLTALFVTNVATMIGTIGAVCTSLLMFWFPAIIFVRILYPVQPAVVRSVVVAVMLFCGICCSAALVVNVYASITGDNLHGVSIHDRVRHHSFWNAHSAEMPYRIHN